jgi:hypothetical protein
MSSIFLRYFVCRPRVEFKASFDLQTMLPWGEPRRLQVVAGRGFEEQGQILVRSVAWCTLWVFFQCSLKLIEIAVPTWWNVVGKFQETLQFCGGLFVDRLQVPLYYPVRMRSVLKLLPCPTMLLLGLQEIEKVWLNSLLWQQWALKESSLLDIISDAFLTGTQGSQKLNVCRQWSTLDHCAITNQIVQPFRVDASIDNSRWNLATNCVSSGLFWVWSSSQSASYFSTPLARHWLYWWMGHRSVTIQLSSDQERVVMGSGK